MPGRDGPPLGRAGAAGALLLKTGFGPRGAAGAGRWTRGGINGARLGTLAGGGDGRKSGASGAPPFPASSSVAPSPSSLLGGAGGRSLNGARARSSSL